MKRLVTLLFFFSTAFLGYAQSFGIDPNFKPYFDVTGPQALGGGLFGEILENPDNGKIFITGSFTIGMGVNALDGIMRINRNGSRDFSFKGIGFSDGISLIQQINDTVLMLSGGSGKFFMIDTTGADTWTDWNTNSLLSVKCGRVWRPYFFADGSSLMSKGTGNGKACDIIQPPDTFPHRYILKIDSLGLWDSTFTKEANEAPRDFLAYDSSRIWLVESPLAFQTYDSVVVDGIARIYHDGTLDTTFSSPILRHLDVGNFRVGETEEDGKFIIYGYFLIKGDSVNHRSMIRCNADGSLDTTFNNFGQVYSHFSMGAGDISTYARTEDNGYLVGGLFDSIQGVAKNRIAKLDSNGFLQSQYLNSDGPDSAYNTLGIPYYVGKITRSAFGGYYVHGDFLKWDGQLVQPMVRLNGLLVGEKEIRQKKQPKVNVFPNPTTGDLQILIDQKNEVNRIVLYDLLGRERRIQITMHGTQSFRLNLEVLQKGTYFLRLQLQDGNVLSKKIIKN